MNNYSILIVDDEDAQRSILKGYLEKKGYKIYSASSGTEGIKTVQNNLINIVLSDFKMPDKTGLEVLEVVKKINPEISFVILTAYGTIEDAVKAMRLGAFDYISKPVDLDELDLMIERIIEHNNLGWYVEDEDGLQTLINDLSLSEYSDKSKYVADYKRNIGWEYEEKEYMEIYKK